MDAAETRLLASVSADRQHWPKPAFGGSDGRVIAAISNWRWPWRLASNFSHLLMLLPKLKASMSSSMKRMVVATMAKALGLG
jgi:hypothetical protein